MNNLDTEMSKKNYDIEPLDGFEIEKAAQIVAYFALKENDHKIEKIKLAKLVYLAERKSIEHRNRPMLYDDLVSLGQGPVCSHVVYGLNGLVREERKIWKKYIRRDIENDIIGMKNAKIDLLSLDLLSKSDTDILDEIWKNFGNYSTEELVQWTHKNCTEYTETMKGYSPISYESMASAVGIKDTDSIEDITYIIKRHREMAVKTQLQE